MHTEDELIIKIKYHIITLSEYRTMAYVKVLALYPVDAAKRIDERFRDGTIKENGTYGGMIKIIKEELCNYEQSRH